MIEINGIKKIDRRNSIPEINETKPVRPPAVIPAVPSTVDTEGLEPKSAHPIVDNDTAIIALEVLSDFFSIPETWL